MILSRFTLLNLILIILGTYQFQHPFLKIWIRDVPISFGMDVWYCLGRDHTTQGRAQHTHYSSVGMLRLV